jgi:hypothetical protein
MSDSVNLASINRLQRQLPQGNPSNMSSSVRSGRKTDRRGARPTDKVVVGATGAARDKEVEACRLLLRMASAGPGGKEEALYAHAIMQELALASGTEMERFQYCGSSWFSLYTCFTGTKARMLTYNALLGSRCRNADLGQRRPERLHKRTHRLLSLPITTHTHLASGTWLV